MSHILELLIKYATETDAEECVLMHTHQDLELDSEAPSGSPEDVDSVGTPQ